MVFLAAVHVVFPRYFDWKRELAGLSRINREIMVVHTLFVAVTVFLMGLLALGSAEHLVSTRLGQRVSGGFALFWGLRLWVQFFGYSPKNWWGKPFETAVHIVFAVTWAFLTFVFARAWWG